MSREQTKHEQWLLELTGIPTAAGCEDRVVAWVRQWLERRKTRLRLKVDPSGNLVITQRRTRVGKPIFITAHLDHPAFVVRRLVDDRTLELEFRGGVYDPYFENASLEIFDADDRVHRAVITSLDSSAKPYKRVAATLTRSTDAIAVGDIGRWAFRGRGRTPVIHQGMLYTPACDDLAAVAAALATLDVCSRRKATSNVGVLLTVAEEVGFVGAIAACKHQSFPKTARLICLENSRSFVDSPIGAGPILRVGDKLSVFDPSLTNRLGEILLQVKAKRPSFVYQRKLMPGGTCEATAFSAYGYESTCVCLPLANYHNMADINGVVAGKRPARVAPERISVADYHGMIDLLVTCSQQLDTARIKPLRDRMDRIHRRHRHVLDG